MMIFKGSKIKILYYPLVNMTVNLVMLETKSLFHLCSVFFPLAPQNVH